MCFAGGYDGYFKHGHGGSAAAAAAAASSGNNLCQSSMYMFDMTAGTTSCMSGL